ncbi:helix-turn-helix domain-containing protein [Kribbella sp. NPDC051587]|uniref:helix-turn-helix domain-containing protein n=1 Tax=Kribbella sp. NPDC051587 TaxID=3364119 RepID=UPI0037B1E8A2
MARKLLHLDEAAARLRRSPSQLRWMVHNGTAPPSARIAGRRMFDEELLDAWIERQFMADSSRSA